MMSPMMLAAISYRVCLARCGKHAGIDPASFSDKAHCFGGIPIVVLLGDFMQLAPLGEEGGRMSLLMDAREKCRAETRAGLRLFKDALTHVIFLQTTHRFVDRSVRPPKTCPVLPRLLEYMRSPGGKPMPDDLWKAVKSWVVSGPQDSRLHGPRQQVEGFQMAIAWEAVARMMQYRAASDAAKAREMLIYVPAVDVAKTCQLTRDEYRRALQVVNMTKTGKLLGMCPLFVGMRVRLNVKLSPKHKVMHDAAGTVMGFEFDPMEKTWWKSDATHAARLAGHVTLEYLPQAVYVKFDGLQVDVGIGAGILPIRPTKGSWVYKAHRSQSGRRNVINVDMKRIQIPLAPEKVRTVQTAQGLSMDAAMMLLTKPQYMSMDDWWMHLYVMISRVRTSAQILVYDLPPKEVFERGPPTWVQQGLCRLEAKAAQCATAIEDARNRMKWHRGSEAAPPTCSEVRPIVSTGCGQDVDMRGTDRDLDPGVALPVHAASAELGVVSVATKQEADMRNAERVEEAGVDIDSGDVCDTVGNAAEPLSLTHAPSVIAGTRRLGATARTAPPRSTAKTDGKEHGSPLEPGILQRPPLASNRRRLRTKVPSVQANHTTKADGEDHGPSLEHCSFEPLPSASGRLNEKASQEPAQALSFLHKFPESRLRSLYPAMGEDDAGGNGTGLVMTSSGAGLPNQGVNACFVNVALQCFLRVEPATRLITAHLRTHDQPDDCCIACALGRLALALRSAASRKVVDSSAALLRHVRSGRFDPDMKSQRAGNAVVHPQCDAAEVLLGTGSLKGLVQVLDAWEDDVAGGKDCDESGAGRHALSELVCGGITRNRLCCFQCGAVSDRLERATHLDLQVDGQHHARTLTALLDEYFSEYYPEGVRCPNECGCHGPHCVRAKRFLEKEPSVLFLRLNRMSRDGSKNKAPVQFPKVLTFLRSGPYHFASVIRHVGDRCDQGHYIATCWRGGDEYTVYDDAILTPVTWQATAAEDAQRQAYVLIYVRARFWQGVACDGTEETPYERDEASKAATQRRTSHNLVAASDESASGPAPMAQEVGLIEQAVDRRARGQKRERQAPGDKAGAQTRRSARIRARAELGRG